MDFNFEVFEGKTFSDLLKEIHKNSSDKKQQIELLISEVTSFMTDADTAVQIVPLIAQYLEVGVKNDEQLVKLAVVVQRLLNKVKVKTEESTLLSEQEKQQLISSLSKTAKDLDNKMNKLENNDIATS
tara:strand:- start:310 stop:693 length:384 start_codon:yes stop_codon:yes gene_type:complete